MPERALFFSAFMAVRSTEVFIVFAIASVAYFLAFNNFERHLPLPRRVTKLFVVVGVLAAIGILFGRVAFWGLITMMTIGQIYLHAWYFPQHGINGLTAEPYDKYLETIEKMKGKS
jgi:hypothetical protein